MRMFNGVVTLAAGVLLLLPGGPAAAQAGPAAPVAPPVPGGPYFGFVVESALEMGGDPVATVLFDDGESQDVNGGQGITLSVGGLFRPSRTSPFGVRATAGLKYVTTAADNAHIRLTRIPVEVIGTYNVTPDVWVGGGYVRHAMVRFNGDGIGPDLDFDDANGGTVEVGWRFVALSYTAMEYTDEDGNTYNASNGGIVFTWAFGK
jgi:hypothetical protein